MTPETYVACLINGTSPQESVTGLHGRIIRGHNPSDFETLSNDRDRPTVYLTDSDGLAAILAEKTTHDMLKAVGYDDGHIGRLKGENTQFKIVVFPESESYPADWDGLLDLTLAVYPDTQAAIGSCRDRLKSTPFTHYEVMAGFEFGDHDKKTDPRFMSYDSRSDCADGETWLTSDKGLLSLRRLLYHALHVRELYRGDGFTEGPDGQRNVREYLIHNKRISDIAGAQVADLQPL